VRFAVARHEGLTEDDVTMIDDGYATSSLSARRKAAIALTDAVLGRADADRPALARELVPAELVELGVTAVLCHGFSKIAIALGAAPADMPVTIIPSPTPPERA
jgi:alkylhydroperoxidase family enzyme